MIINQQVGGRLKGWFVTTDKSVNQIGTSCTAGSRRKYDLSWTTNSIVTDSAYEVEIYEQVNDGGYALVYTETSPKTNESYVRETDYYEESGGTQYEIDHRFDLVYTPPTPDQTDDSATELDGLLWWGTYCPS
jgi:hypothetical protein